MKCIIYNKKLGKKEGFLHQIDKGSEPLHTIHVDHLGPMDATSKHYKNIYAMVDSFSKFVWMYPTKTTGADEVLKKLQEWSDIFGNPARIVSDRGAAFTSSSFEEFVKEENIKHVWGTTGVPRGNGQIERVNRSILSIISKLSSEEPGRWYKFVPRVQMAINGTVHESTKRSPFELLIGIKMRCRPDSDILQLIEKEMVDNFDDEREKMRQEAKDNIQQAQKKYKEQFDKKRKCEYG